MQYPTFDEKKDLNFDKLPTNESIYIDPKKINYQKELHVSKQKYNEEKTYTNRPQDDDYKNNQNENNFSLFNNNDK